MTASLTRGWRIADIEDYTIVYIADDTYRYWVYNSKGQCLWKFKTIREAVDRCTDRQEQQETKN